MAITTSIARHYAVRLIVMAIVMLVLGLWGVYDYVYAIPAKQQRFERFQVMQLTKQALQTDLDPEQQASAQKEATARVGDELLKLVNEHAAKAGVEPFPADNLQWHALLQPFVLGTVKETPDDPKLKAIVNRFTGVVDSVRAAGDDGWLTALLLCDQGLRTPRKAGETLTGVPLKAYEFTSNQINEIAPDGAVPSRPSKFDQAMQWCFIACLPCVPYFLWIYFATTRQVYKLDDEGAFHSPQGTWPADAIADIDMSKWMAKSVAWVVNKNGSRVLLDDYKFRDTHKIVGALAHRFDPEKWTTEAKLVKKGGDADDEAGDAEADQDAENEVHEGEKPV